MPAVPGATMAEKRAYLQERLDHVRRMLLFEPRGHKDMFGAFLLPPCRPEADAGVVFMDSGSYLNMCGHGSIGVVTALLETGMVPCAGEEADVTLDTPSGLIRARAKLHNGRVREVTVRNVPAFLYREGVPVALSDGRTVHADIAFGGNFFALVEAEEAGVALDAADKDRLTARGAEIRDALNAAGGIAIRSCPTSARSTSWNSAAPRGTRAPTRATSWSSGTDRSTAPPAAPGRAPSWPSCAPGGASAGEALCAREHPRHPLHRRGRRGHGAGRLPRDRPGDHRRAYVTGLAQYLLDPEDPLGGGFLL